MELIREVLTESWDDRQLRDCLSHSTDQLLQAAATHHMAREHIVFDGPGSCKIANREEIEDILSNVE
jgi:hypothetical protein